MLPIAADLHKIFACQVLMEDHIIRKDGQPFARSDFQSQPDHFCSTFAETVSWIELIESRSNSNDSYHLKDRAFSYHRH